MKRLITLLLAMLMLVCVTGCAGSSSASEDADSKEAAATPSPTPTATPTPTPTSTPSSTSAPSVGSTARVTCSMCNGTGKVRYYYGDSALEAALDGENDYEYGICTSCNGTGYTDVKVQSGSGTGSSSSVVCPSCGKQVTSLISKADAAGVTRRWCSDCWAEYNAIMG